MNEKVRLATVWLDGCSGCHMSFVDIDERILEVAKYVDLVHSPLVDTKEFPENVDVALVEGAVSSEEDLEKIKIIRERSKLVLALGDCAVTGNVPSMRNSCKVDDLYQRAYVENTTADQQIPRDVVPPLTKRARPLHEVVKIDLHIPGCPPSADTIFKVITELLDGRIPDLGGVACFG